MSNTKTSTSTINPEEVGVEGGGEYSVTNTVIEQKEGIKLTKNAKGDYQWEIRVLHLDVEKLDEINKKLEEKYGRKK